MKCPKCGLLSPPDAGRCDCGYDFAAGRVAGSFAGNAVRGQSHPLVKTGKRLALMGFLAMWFLGFAHRQLGAAVIVGALGDLGALVMFTGLTLWLIGGLRRRRQGREVASD